MKRLWLLALIPMSVPCWASAEEFSDAEHAFRQAKEILATHHVEAPASEGQLYRAAVEGMIKDGGKRKWDALLSPTELAELKAGLDGEVVGIGVVIRFDEGSGIVTVTDIIPGSSAEKNAIKIGDGILKVDGRSFKGQSLADIVAAMRGKEGSQVSLTLLRGTQVFETKLSRNRIVVPTVTTELMPGGLGLVRIDAFAERTPADLERGLQKLAQQSPRALVFDFRDDAGGLFDKMMDCAGLVLPTGSLVVTMLGRGGERQPQVARGKAILTQLPAVVLVDSETASSAEILAGALKHARHAKVVGKKTVGKWNVQRLETLSNKWAIKYTTGTFEAPWGEKLDGVGLLPDVEVDGDALAVEKARRLTDWKERLKADPQLRSAVGMVSP